MNYLRIKGLAFSCINQHNRVQTSPFKSSYKSMRRKTKVGYLFLKIIYIHVYMQQTIPLSSKSILKFNSNDKSS